MNSLGKGGQVPSPGLFQGRKLHVNKLFDAFNQNSINRWQPQGYGLLRRLQPSAMSIGFTSDQEPPLENSGHPTLIVPEYGLSVPQMRVLGLTADGMTKVPEVEASSITAKAFYAGDDVKPTKQAVRMAVDTKAPGQAPPDLPSLLLDGRICYIGMPLVPSVTELVISELLWLNYASPEKPIYVYINSTGSQTAQGEAVGFETEATAILDTMSYVRPDIYTLVIGQAFGNAAMILASGKKGHRFSLPHSRIMTCPPRLNRSFGNVSDVMIKANELEKSTEIYVEHLAKYTGRDKETVRKDVGRNRYFTPEQAIDYGLIDRVVSPNEGVAMESKDYEAMLQASQAQMASRRRSGGGAPAAADA